MKEKFTYEYERPAVTVDCVVFGLDDDKLKVLLVKRGIEPFEGSWVLPGGFITMTETAEDAAIRILKKETNIEGVFLEQLYTFSDVARDPRERIISIAYYALVRPSDYLTKAGLDEKKVTWNDVNSVPDLAFDHKHIFDVALERLKGKIRYQPIGFELLPPKFKLSQLQNLYEVILNTNIDKRNFRRKILQMDLLTETGEKESNVAHKAAMLYKFNKQKYDELTLKGFNFEI